MTPPAGTSDPTPANNSATDTTTITATWCLLDNFNRANAFTLAPNWGQLTVFGGAAVRVNANQAFALINGQAMWNPASAVFGPKQGAQITFANSTLGNTSLILKATGGTASIPSKFIRVRYQTNNGGQVIVSTTTNSGNTYNQLGPNLSAAFVNGDKLGAIVDALGAVSIYKTSGATGVTTLVGTRQAPASGTSSFPGSGRIGIQMPTGGRIDNFSGGNTL